MTLFLDKNGLSTLWEKIKNKITAAEETVLQEGDYTSLSGVPFLVGKTSASDGTNKTNSVCKTKKITYYYSDGIARILWDGNILSSEHKMTFNYPPRITLSSMLGYIRENPYIKIIQETDTLSTDAITEIGAGWIKMLADSTDNAESTTVRYDKIETPKLYVSTGTSNDVLKADGEFADTVTIKATLQDGTKKLLTIPVLAVEDDTESTDYITADDFTANSNLANGGGTVKENNQGYVVLGFDKASQGFTVTNSTFVKAEDTSTTDFSTKATLDEVQIKAYSDEDLTTEVTSDVLGDDLKVGFIDADGNYTVTEGSSLLVDSVTGVQFKVSSSYSGTLPLYITLRAKITFS